MGNNEQTRTATRVLLDRFQRDVQKIAKDEPVTVDRISGCYCVYGSELACLRIFAHYQKTPNPRARVNYSTNLKTWFFSLEPVF